MMKHVMTWAICALMGGNAWASSTNCGLSVSSSDSLESRVKKLEKLSDDMQSEQEMNNTWKRHKSVSFSYGWQTLKLVDADLKQKADFAVGFTWIPGHVKFHKKPIGGVAMIGLDIGLDLNYAQYAIEIGYPDDFKLLQAEAGLPIGPCVKLAPLASLGNGWQHLRVLTYWHMTPSVSAIAESGFEDGSVAFNFFNNIGFGVAYKAIGIGYEYRFGQAKYNDIVSNDDEENGGYYYDVSSPKLKLKTTTNRIFLRLNF